MATLSPFVRCCCGEGRVVKEEAPYRGLVHKIKHKPAEI